MELKCERSRDKKESNQSALRSPKEAEDDADPYFHIQSATSLSSAILHDSLC